MAASRLLRPASRLLPTSSRALRSSLKPRFRPALPMAAYAQRRTYATPSGVKEVMVRDALNEALAEELELNDKVFILGEEVAQYNGA
jgi:pyruvate dehydrogenase E1 component beta subunit